MFRQLRVTAYDVLDQVAIVVQLQETEEATGDGSRWATVVQTRIQSTGEADRTEWARDALIAAVEAL